MGEKKSLKIEKLEINVEKVLIDRGEEKETEIVLGERELLKIILLPSVNHPLKNLKVYLKGDGSRAEVLGIIPGKGHTYFDITVSVIHQGVNTSAYTHVRGVLFDESKAQFRGLIRIDKGANKTSSLLENRMLILGQGARADSIPSLEIEADDVKASHAATIGRIDEQQLFYLQSRGIERKTATRMVVDGFFEPIISEIGNESVAALIRGDLWVDILKVKSKEAIV